MRKNNFIFLLLLISLLAVLFTTCKKYPEDEFISLRTVKQRLEAEWQIQKIEFNGNDVTYMYNDSLSQSLDSYRLWIDLNVQIQPNNKATSNYVYLNKNSKSKNDAKDIDIAAFIIAYQPTKNKKIWLGIAPHSSFPFSIKDSTTSEIFLNNFSNFQKWDVLKLYKTEMIWWINNGVTTKKIFFKKTRNK